MTINKLLKLLKKVPLKLRKNKVQVFGDLDDNGNGTIIFNGKSYRV